MTKEQKAQRDLRKLLLSEKEVVCLNPAAYIAMLNLGLTLLHQGRMVAKVVKGY